MSVPKHPKIYHILHYDKLPPVLKNGFLYSDEIITANASSGTTIGMSKIKRRRLEECELSSHPELFVGQCVPFYFCPRSVMLYLIHKRNSELEYQGGQSPIVHLVADLFKAITWAEQNGKRWAFTSSNAGSYYFEDFKKLSQLDKINWDAIRANYWSSCREEKQAELLIEDCFPWDLVEQIGIISTKYYRIVDKKLAATSHKPKIEVRQEWYY
jgi:hypothetical protein